LLFRRAKNECREEEGKNEKSGCFDTATSELKTPSQQQRRGFLFAPS
jgi:hypothetical protein